MESEDPRGIVGIVSDADRRLIVAASRTSRWSAVRIDGQLIVMSLGGRWPYGWTFEVRRNSLGQPELRLLDPSSD